MIMAFTLALLPAVSDNTGVYVLFDTVHFRSLSTVSDSGEFSTLQQVSRVGSRASDLKYDMMPLTQVCTLAMCSWKLWWFTSMACGLFCSAWSCSLTRR